ncbi:MULTISPECIES: DUF5133 domain-containing protein [unclassified Corynebacterium]|uniref:DUF5133 domain-containing protein n=1 Tax=unclassified Corynebacterium TaxID=2624378 RepID=UPI001EF65416|nr:MULTISPECIES: DUF5133 domain-containing protein [unclassified Corynebacterium]MCG7258873.1 DUF5133 domain-containing protein [Corynebacterium sp. ACRQK]MCG7263187.1 DUF5133 domain-containing protein [Corynebacterium sp. ACRQL]
MGINDEFTEANNARNSNWYQIQGAEFHLPEGYVCGSQPEWRLAHFAVVLPVPELPEAFDWPEAWVPGRFRGIKKIEFAERDEEGDFVRQFWGNNWGNKIDYKYVPRVFHKSAGSYFREPLASSMGASAVDAVPTFGGDPAEWISDASTNPAKVVAHRLVFEPDLTTEGKQWAPEMETYPLRFALDDTGHPYATLKFVCAEYLQYSGPCLYDLESGEPSNFEQNFLVIHAVAENCSGKALEEVTASLTKPREKMTLIAEGGDGEARQRELLQELTGSPLANNEASVCLLEAAVKVVEKQLFVGSETHIPWDLTKGGYFKNPGRGTKANRGRQSPKPYCVTMAIPGRTDIALPTPIADASEESGENWMLHDQWAWYFASRFDRYTTEIPYFRDGSINRSLVSRYRDWTIHSCEEGLAVVRRAPLENSQNNFFMLAGTRFVDLAILALRADNYLGRISEQLRQLSFGPEALNVLESSGSEGNAGTLEKIRGADQKLQGSLRKFAKIQAELVYVRDHLWYERVPGRDVATTILQHMLEKTGARGDFEDIVGELEIRENVYTTQYNFARIRLDGIEADAHKRKQERRDERNELIALAAAVLAIPSLFALLPAVGQWWVFIVCLVAIVVISAVTYFSRRQRRKKQSS